MSKEQPPPVSINEPFPPSPFTINNSEEQNKPQEKPDVSKEVINHLSKEIETTTNNMMVFRSKIAFAIFAGPFIILAAVVASKGPGVWLDFDALAKTAIFIVGFCYLGMAYMAARMDQQAGEQCNEWRGIIAALHKEPSTDILTLIKVSRPRRNIFNLFGLLPMKPSKDKRTPKLFNKYRANDAYLITYSLLLLSFVMLTIIVGKIKTTTPSINPSDTNITTQEQKASPAPEPTPEPKG